MLDNSEERPFGPEGKPDPTAHYSKPTLPLAESETEVLAEAVAEEQAKVEEEKD